jgi:type VI protein secretion system component Hcp
MLKTKLVTAALATVVAALAAVPSAQAATDYFMKLHPNGSDPAIKGEAVDNQYKEWIQVESFSWGAENVATIGSATSGAGAGKTKLNELTVEKAVDSTSPAIFQRLAQGRHFAAVEIVARKAGGTATAPSTHPRWLFQMAFVSSQKQSGSGGDDVPQEELTFAYGAISQKQFRPGVAAASGTVFGNWSQVLNSNALTGLPSDW